MKAQYFLRRSLEADIHFEALGVPFELVWRLRHQRLILRNIYRNELREPPTDEMFAEILERLEAVYACVPAYQVVRNWFSPRTLELGAALVQAAYGYSERQQLREAQGGEAEDALDISWDDFGYWTTRMTESTWGPVLPTEDLLSRHPAFTSCPNPPARPGLPGLAERDLPRKAADLPPREIPYRICWDASPEGTPFERGCYAMQVIEALETREPYLNSLRQERIHFAFYEPGLGEGSRLGTYRLHRSEFYDLDDEMRPLIDPYERLSKAGERMCWLAEELVYHDVDPNAITIGGTMALRQMEDLARKARS
ncbi:MAG: hypothetical protein FJX77_10795 [Armatimonadetes bacterium]|nr:hypothetical protein [Armatimonadota bacterium]